LLRETGISTRGALKTAVLSLFRVDHIDGILEVYCTDNGKGNETDSGMEFGRCHGFGIGWVLAVV
jgi:hypothetical protein